MDTAFLKLHEKELRELAGSNFSKYALMHEGLYSCYIDAVALEIAPSSFCSKSLYTKFNPRMMNSIRNIWKKLEVV